jgi:sugar lactone lactonase YvrE
MTDRSKGAVLAAILLAGALVAHAAQPQFWRIEGARDFLEGETQGLTVDSEGRVRLAPASRVVHDPEAPYVWCLAQDGKGNLFAGTGSEGKVFKIEMPKEGAKETAKGTVFFDASELEVHALAMGPDGRLYVGSSPDGKVYAVDATGRATSFFDPTDKYIWALAFDKAGNLLVATGAEAKIYRVDPKGQAQTIFTSPETHILSLASDDKGNVYAGSAPSGIVYRIDPALKVFVLNDSPYREVKALDVGPDGSVYAAVVDGKQKDEGAPPSIPQAVATTVSPAPVAEVTVTETFAIIPPSAGGPPPIGPRPVETPAPGTAKGAVLRVAPSGEVDTLWSSADDVPQALVFDREGPLVGTGNKGKLYQVRNDRTWSMISAFPSEQVTALTRRSGGGAALATSNPGRIYALDSAAGDRGTFTSKPKDTDTVSSWGRVRWEATLPKDTHVEIQTRSGNTGAPDSTWTAWSSVYTNADGDAVTSERARFLQIRAVLVGKAGMTPVLDSVTAAFLQRNLRPQVQTITIHPPGEVFQKPLSVTGEMEILGLEPALSPDRAGAASAARSGLPPATSYSRKLYQRGIQTISWKAEDPNGDTLTYEVHYRPVGEQRFRLLRKGLTDAVLAWDTTTVPNGRYVIRVTASDAPSNPDALALSGDKESTPVEVDNTPPVITASVAGKSPARVHVAAKDDNSIIRKVEYSVDGSRWEEVHPTDGINDSREETYDFAPEMPAGAGPHVVVVRATDLLGNVATARVEVP